MPQDSKPSRRSKDRAEGAPVPTDLVERMVQLQRKNATFSITRTRERTERTLPPIFTTIAPRSPPAPSEPPRRPLPAPQHPLPHVVVPSSDPVNADDFSRRLNISSSPRTRPAKAQSKLFNPNTDPIPMRRTHEPESMSDDTGSSYARGSSKPGPTTTTTQRQLYDHKRDDPVRFASGRKPAPTPKSSGDYLSSASSHAPSFTSSSFTFSSSTDGSSDPSSIFDGSRPRDEPKPNNALSTKLKRTYRDITELEAKILREEPDDSAEDGRILLRAAPDAAKEDPEGARWQRMVRDHKELAELMSWLLEESTAPIHPISMRSIPVKYNIVARLWSHAFNRLLEKLRVAAQASKLALEHLQSFINYAYTYYTILYEHPFLDSFKSHWLESLGSLARYRLAVLALSPEPVAPPPFLSVSSYGGTTPYPLLTPTSTMGNASESSGRLIERVDDSPSPSVGIVAARNFDLEPDKEHWRAVARQWYGIGLVERPGEGRLHQYLGQLSRDVEGEDLRTIYHFSKSLIATHPSAFSREHVIQSWSPAAQARRAQPDSSASDLFVLIHGMLFTNIQLDDFKPSLARLLERLAIEAPESRDWSMMAALNIGALLEYGRPKGVLRSAGLVLATDRLVSPAPKVKLARKEQEADSMDVDKEALAQRTSNGGGEHSSPTLSEPSASEATPPAFTMAVELTFTMLSHALDSVTSHAGVTSYITIILTFLATVFKTPDVAAQLERAMPWSKLARVLSKAPSRALQSSQSAGEKLPTRAALPEDWCVRGMAWTGRQLFERGFWKTDEPDDALPLSGSMTVSREMEVLDERGPPRGSDGDDGMLVDEDDGDRVEDTDLRWQRVAWAGARFSRLVDGFTWRGDRAWSIEGPLAAKVAMWAQEERLAKEEEEQRLRGTRWSVDDTMELDADGMDNPGESSSQSEDDDEDSEEVRELKARRRYLRNLLQPVQRSATPPTSSAPPTQRRKRPHAAPKGPVRPSLKLVPGFSVLVMDTNILLSSLAMVTALVESGRWTVVVPLPVIMELDGLGTNATALGEAAKSAVAFLVSHVRSHSTSLKVQTSRGNYLSSLNVRSEVVDFSGEGEGAWERNMDDLILRAAVWQDEHWVDRSAILGGDGERGRERDTKGAAKVVLLSLDRNLRLKARARQLDAASETDLAFLLAAAGAA